MKKKASLGFDLLNPALSERSAKAPAKLQMLHLPASLSATRRNAAGVKIEIDPPPPPPPHK